MLQDKRINLKTLSLSSVFLAFSVIISIIEGMSGINALIPLPGVKLGLCNIATCACFYLVSKKSAFAIAVIRPLFLFVFTSNPVSFLLGFCGSIMSFLSLVMTYKLYDKVFSFAGISCISAVFHSIGQIIGAIIIMQDKSLLLYLPLLICASSLTGSLCGILMNKILPLLSKHLSLMKFGGMKI